MITLEEIKEAVSGFSGEELADFREWFWEFDAEKWDEELEADIEAGKLDKLIEEARAEYREGKRSR